MITTPTTPLSGVKRFSRNSPSCHYYTGEAAMAPSDVVSLVEKSFLRGSSQGDRMILI